MKIGKRRKGQDQRNETMNWKPSFLQSDATCIIMFLSQLTVYFIFFLNNSHHKKKSRGWNDKDINYEAGVTSIFSIWNGGHISPLGSILLLLLIHISSLMTDSMRQRPLTPFRQSEMTAWFTRGFIAHHGELVWERGFPHEMNPQTYRTASFWKGNAVYLSRDKMTDVMWWWC